MGQLKFIIGGVRSGKSSYAVGVAKGEGNPVTFIATAIAFDEEIQKRINIHKSSRPSDWCLIEEGKDIAGVLCAFRDKKDVNTILIDCLGIFVTNLLMDKLSEEDILRIISDIIDIAITCKHTVIIVSNEVGHGIVPDNLLARRFRDLIGITNQTIAKSADQVVFMQCGIPTLIKGGKQNE